MWAILCHPIIWNVHNGLKNSKHESIPCIIMNTCFLDTFWFGFLKLCSHVCSPGRVFNTPPDLPSARVLRGRVCARGINPIGLNTSRQEKKKEAVQPCDHHYLLSIRLFVPFEVSNASLSCWWAFWKPPSLSTSPTLFCLPHISEMYPNWSFTKCNLQTAHMIENQNMENFDPICSSHHDHHHHILVISSNLWSFLSRLTLY